MTLKIIHDDAGLNFHKVNDEYKLNPTLRYLTLPFNNLFFQANFISVVFK